MRKSLTIALAIALGASGCGSGARTRTSTKQSKADESAARFAVRHEVELAQRQFAAAWRSLHPSQKRVISVARLASCFPRDAYRGHVTFRARTVTNVRWTVPGSGNASAAKAVKLTATSADGSVTFTHHVVRVDGRWTWALSRESFEKVRRRRC